MGIGTLLLLALGLSMDACAVSVSNGMCFKKIVKKEILLMAIAFGFFQGFMPVLGYLLGQTFSGFISAFDHWVALILLGAIGLKMIIETIRDMKSEGCCDGERPFTMQVLLLQAVATSIDALAVGISFAVMDVNIWSAACFIGIVTFACSLAGSFLGSRFGQFLKTKAQFLGGAILIGIGLKIFIEHMFF